MLVGFRDCLDLLRRGLLAIWGGFVASRRKFTPDCKCLDGSDDFCHQQAHHASREGVHEAERSTGEVEFMKDELSSMNALLHRLAEEDQHLDVQMKEWRNQVREMSYDIEDCIDDFMHHHLGHTDIAESAGLVHRVAQHLKALRARHQIANQIEKLKARVEDASKRRLRYKLDERTSNLSTAGAIDPRLPSLYAESDGLVGIEQPRDVVIKLLTEEEGASSQKLKVISIVGPGGLGKTKLANEVYRKLESQFQCRAFVSLSQQPDVKKIVRNIYCQVSQQEHANLDIWDEEKLINATGNS